MDTDRNLLFGVLALQADLIDAAQFAEICSAWTARMDIPLRDLLVERRFLTPAEKSLVEQLMERKLQKSGGDVDASLTASVHDEARRVLTAVKDPDIQHSLSDLTYDYECAPSSSLPHPQSRERYTRTKLHARGGIGQVWLARDGELGRDVALKELRPDRAENPVTWERFLKEARVTGQLEHPGIVPIYDLARRSHDQQPFYTMRFVKGHTLAEAITAYHQKRIAGTSGSLDRQALLNAFVAVCNAVAFAHSRGVIHRDLKPQNIVAGDYGEVIVLDWGLAKLLDRPEQDPGTPPVVLEEEQGATMPGQVLGTPAYMAPEQAAGRLDLIDQRTDVYGLGAILYEILTGGPPFAGSSSNEILRKVQTEEPERPRLVCRDVAPALDAVRLRALARRPADRYARAKDLAEEVRRWLADEPVEAWPEPWAARARRWARRHRTTVAGVVVALAAGVVGLAAVTGVQAQANVKLARCQHRHQEGPGRDHGGQESHGRRPGEVGRVAQAGPGSEHLSRRRLPQPRPSAEWPDCQGGRRAG